jgi:Ca2+-transporting ATPase
MRQLDLQRSRSPTATREAARDDRLPARAWSRSVDDVAQALAVDPTRGLSTREAAARLLLHGRNRLREPPPRSAWRIWLGQFRSLVAALLAAATIASFLSGHRVEGAAILAVLLLNSLVGFATELRAVRSMEALRRLTRTRAKVWRDGDLRELGAEQLVPGDVVTIEAGDVVPADLRLLEASRLETDESTLTGESMPVAKSTAAVEAEAPLVERSGSLFGGTAVTRGSGLAVVVATGAATELGRIADLAESAEPQRTPLERRIERLASRLIGITVAIAAATVALGVARGRDLREMVEIGVALAIAAVPEGLPIVATLALARGAWRLAHRHVLVRRLSAVASLGAANVILTDKTGTLTENRLTAVRLVLAERDVTIEGLGLETAGRFLAANQELDPTRERELCAALEIALLCNNAALADDGSGALGDPLEVALLVAAAKAGLRRPDLLARYPEQREEAFDAAIRAMATYHLDGARFRIAVKGAPEAVIAACTFERCGAGTIALSDQRRSTWLARSDQLAHAGLRLLALAEKRVATLDEPPYRDLEIVALVGLLDPPRHEVRESLALCRRAGVRVVMVTGDQAGTARAVARELELLADGETTVLEGRELPLGELAAPERERLAAIAVFARVEPEQKLRLIRLHQQRGDVVAMLGDGVNDAPALRQADIGVAMGRRGTQVAREAADLVLEDDAFASIVGAVRQGRVILSNLRRFALYLMSCNASEILLVAGAAALGSPLPLLPLQILYLNLVTDVFPALALGFGEGDPHVMERPPAQAREPLLAARHWCRIGTYAALLATTVMVLLLVVHVGFGWSEKRTVTVCFLGLALAQLGHVFDMRSRGSRLFANDVVRNPWIWGALVLCLALLAAAVYLPGLRGLLGAVDPGGAGWGLAATTGLVPLAITQLGHAVSGRRRQREEPTR